MNSAVLMCFAEGFERMGLADIMCLAKGLGKDESCRHDVVSAGAFRDQNCKPTSDVLKVFYYITL